MPSLLAAVLVLLSSAAVLVLEVLVSRLVAPYVGLTLETYTASIGVALGAIAAGAALGGRLADAVDPRRWLGPALALGGALLLVARPTVFALGPDLPTGPTATVILVAAAVGPSVLVLSTVTPGVVKLRLRTLAETGATVGRLSALGTLGALAGTFLTGFFLLTALPVSRVLLVVGLLLVGLGLALAVLLPRSGSQEPRASTGRARRARAWWASWPPGCSSSADGSCERETRYYCASVVADPSRASGRTLRARRAPALLRRPGRPGAPGVQLHAALRRRGRGAAARPPRRAAPRPGRRHLPAARRAGPARQPQHGARGRPRRRRRSTATASAW